MKIAGVRAFTLLELLLAATISVVVAGMLLALTSNALDLWRRARSDAVAATQAAQALDFIAADLQSAILLDGVPTFACDIMAEIPVLEQHGWNTRGIRAPVGADDFHFLDAAGKTNLHEARFGVGGVWLRFLSTKADTHADARRASAPAVVSYQLRRRSAVAGARYELCRSLVRTGASAGGAPGTFESGYDVTAAAYAAPSTVAGDPGTVTSPSAIDVLASDVIDFGVVIYSRAANGDLVREFPRASPTQNFRAGETRRPAVVDVIVRTLTAEGSQALAHLESSSSPAAGRWQSVAQKHSRLFVRRIEIKRLP